MARRSSRYGQGMKAGDRCCRCTGIAAAEQTAAGCIAAAGLRTVVGLRIVGHHTAADHIAADRSFAAGHTVADHIAAVD